MPADRFPRCGTAASALDRVAPSGFLPDTDDWLGKARFAANVENDFLLDRERQKKVNFSGLENVTPIQDAAMQESMGPIVDRTREHLGASDAAIVQMRRRLINASRQLQQNRQSPPGAEDATLYRKHGDQLLLNPSDSWTEHYAAKMAADFTSLATQPPT